MVAGKEELDHFPCSRDRELDLLAIDMRVIVVANRHTLWLAPKSSANPTPRQIRMYCSEMAERGLEDLEDYYLAAEMLQRVRRGAERTYFAQGCET